MSTASDLDLRRSALRQEIVKRGIWMESWDGLLAIDPDYFAACVQFLSCPAQRAVLSPKLREFLAIAVDASTTHLYAPGLRLHIRNALHLGATRDEIMEVLELAAGIGLQTYLVGLPIVLDELGDGAAGRFEQSVPVEGLSERYETSVGEWTADTDVTARASPSFFEAALGILAAPDKGSRLGPKEREFVLLAMNASVTHLEPDMIRRHARQAIRLGATRDELIGVLQMICGLGLHSCMVGIPILLEESGKP